MGVNDRASHAWGGRRTARTETMYREGGAAYVYLIYGIYSCMNVTAGEAGCAEAVLLRACIPAGGGELLLCNLRRNSRRRALPERAEEVTGREWAKLLDGPGRLCGAMGITRADNGADLVTSDDFFLRDDGFVPGEILCRPRIGIDYAGEAKDYPWRVPAAGIRGKSGGR